MTDAVDSGERQHAALLATTGHLLRRASQWYSAIWAKTVPGGLTSPQYSVLSVLAAVPQLDQQTIGERTALDKSTCGQVVDRLTKLNLISATIDPDNRRRKLIALTDTGRGLYETTRPLQHQVQETALAALTSKDRAELNRLLSKMTRIDDSHSVGRR